MTLLVHEWRKLARLPALWSFLALCLAFNGLLLFEADALREPFNEASALAEELGQRVDADWIARLEARPRTEYEDILLSSVREMTDLFEAYDTKDLAGFYANVMESSPAAQRVMEWKYGLLSKRAARLSETGAAMDLYAGPVTCKAHEFLYSRLFRSVVMEASLLGMLSMLYLLGCEGQWRTASMVCASRTGRRLYRKKLLAGLTAAGFLYALLAGLTLAVYFSLWDYGGMWNASVSSQFNYLTDMLVRRPFLTWADFTVGSYLAAMLAMGAALTAAFSLLAGVCGLLLRNTYLAALVLAVIGFGGVGLVSLLGEAGLWAVYLAALFQLGPCWLGVAGWFTELGMSGVVPWQETAAAGLNLLVWGVGCALALRRFRRKDLT